MIQIITEDCLSVMTSNIQSKSVDVIVTSPPYNLNISYSTYRDNLTRERYLIWMNEFAGACHKVLKDTGSLFLNVGNSCKDPWIVSDVGNIFRCYFILQNEIKWIKSISIGSDTVGHFKPLNSKRFLNNNHETIFHFTFSGEIAIDRLAIGVPYKDKTNLKRRNHTQDRRCQGNNWFIPYSTVNSHEKGKFNHPAAFPVELASRCIQLHGGNDDKIVVLDPFSGIGSTMMAVKALGSRYDGIGIEIDTKYAETSKARLAASIMAVDDELLQPDLFKGIN